MSDDSVVVSKTCVVTHRLLKVAALLGRQRVGLGDEWNDIHFVVKSSHEFYIQRLQAASNELYLLTKGRE